MAIIIEKDIGEAIRRFVEDHGDASASFAFQQGVKWAMDKAKEPPKSVASMPRFTLEELKADKTKVDKLVGSLVLIYSRQWQLFWRNDCCGYTELVEDAGVYSFDKAWASSKHCGKEKGIEYVVIEAS